MIKDVDKRGKLPLLVGGTGLYVRALRRGLFEGPGRSDELRTRLGAIATRRGPSGLHRLLKRWDPASAVRIHPNDRVRIVRALEVCILAGRPMSSMMEARESPLLNFQVILVALAPDRTSLAERIERRVSAMIERGLAEEVRELRARYGENIPAFKAIGYRQMLSYLEGDVDATQVQALITSATLRYAKRQMTWFRHEEGVEWFQGSGDDPGVYDAVLGYLRRALPSQSSETLHAKTAS